MSGTEVTQPSVSSPSGGASKANLRARVFSGSAWTIASFATGNVLRLGSNLVLAHVLFPEAFALVAVASIVLQALQMFSDIGIGPAIVQSARGQDPAFLNTAWTIQAIRGLSLWGVTLVIAWPVAWLYSTPELVWVIPACGLSFITTGLLSTALHTRCRDLELAKITLMGFGETLLKTVITVVWAIAWPSVWAIIGGAFISYLCFTIATHTLLPGPRNRFAWDAEAARHLSRFGRWVFISTAVTFFATQSDRLILGKIVPMDVLGVYSIACMFSRVPYEIGSRLAMQVQFPALAEVFRREPSQLGAKLDQSRRIILAVSQFGVLCIVIVSPWFFTLLYDPRYAQAAIFAPLLAVGAWLSILQASADRALLAFGDAKALAWSNGANCFVTLIGCVAGFGMAGVPGFIGGVALGNLAGHLVVVATLRQHGIRVLRQDFLFTAAGLVIAGVAIGLPMALPAAFPSTASRIVLGVVAILLSGVYSGRVVWPIVAGYLRPSLAVLTARFNPDPGRTEGKPG